MIKKIAAKLKKLFGAKPKVAKVSKPAPAETPRHHKAASNKPKAHTPEKSAARAPQRKPYKKETPEEYRLRRAKRAQTNPEADAKKPESQKSAVRKPESRKPEARKPEIRKPEFKPVDWDESVFNVPAAEGKTSFPDLKISKDILHGIFDLGFQYLTQVQAEVLPKSMGGSDVTAQAQTGTGKTAAFLITIFDKVIKSPITEKRKPGTPRALILAPTRELVLQIEKDALGIGKFIDVTVLSLLGGMNYQKQQTTLRNKPIDVLICTPGRLIDFMRKNLVDLSKVEILVIDEADRMLDMGFIPDVRRIVTSTPPKANRQTMFFSATLTSDVKRLAESWTSDAHEIIVKPEDVTVPSIEQITFITTVDEKPTLLYNLIMQKNLERVLVFVNRRDDAKRLKEKFEFYGISCALLSGDIEQSQRIKRLEKFREGHVRVLVATDVASRGIHVDAISHVINYNMPQDPEEYVHRIGRTGRAGATGISISFADQDDAHEIEKLEEFLGKKLKFTYPEEELLVPIPEKHKTTEYKRPTQRTAHKRPYRGPGRKK